MITFLAIVLLGAGIAGLVIPCPWWWVTLSAWLGWVALSILAIYEEWAPNDFIFTLVDEGTIKAIVRGGAAYRFLLRWQGWHFATPEEIRDKENKQALRQWDIVPDKFPKKESWLRRLLGGLAFAGIPPIQKVLVYRFKWSHLHEDGTIHTHDEWLDYAYAQWDIYALKVSNVEDRNGMPLEITLVIPMRIVNSYEALFEVGRWLPMVTGLLQPPLRRFVGQFSYQELLTMMGTDKENRDLRQLFWQEVDKALEERETRRIVVNEGTRLRIYGVEIDKARAGLNKVDPPEDYRKWTTKRYEAEQLATATVIKGQAEGDAEAKKITTAVIAVAKQMVGLGSVPNDQLSAEQWELIKRKIDSAWERYLTQQGIEAIKPTDKVIITGGGQVVGQDMAGLTLKEVIRRTMMDTNKKGKEEKEE